MKQVNPSLFKMQDPIRTHPGFSGDDSAGPSGLPVAPSEGEQAGLTCHVMDFNAPAGRTGCRINNNPNGTYNVFEFFQMEANFANLPDRFSCHCCEYRQYIRGKFEVNGRLVNHWLPHPQGGPPKQLLPRPHGGGDANFQEDGLVNPPANRNVWYGHRNEHSPGNADLTDRYLPDPRVTGCQYRGIDAPGLYGLSKGDRYRIDLDFRGQIINVCDGNAVKKSNVWTVTCSGVM